MGLRDQLSHAWNAFRDRPKNEETSGFERYSGGGSWGVRPHAVRLGVMNERSLVASIYTRLGVDCATVSLLHAKQNDNRRFVSVVKSGLNECLTESANLDQKASAFRLDVFTRLFDKGVIAIVPVDVDVNPNMTGGYDIKSLRVGEIVDWEPEHIWVKLYDERDGKNHEIRVSKKVAAVVENPFHAVMNEPNSTLQRLIRKLNLLDQIDEATGSGKIDMIIQLPYVIKTEQRRAEAEKRRTDIEMQLKGSQYGIAYTDGTEKITQLNRPVENNMLKQIEFLTNLLYSQLGLTASVFDGSANEQTMLNYMNRTIEPALRAVTESIAYTFLTKTARTQGQTITFIRDPFKLVPLSQLADIVDKLARNEVASSNELRGLFGWTPSDDPKADKLINSNMPQSPGSALDRELDTLKGNAKQLTEGALQNGRDSTA